MFFSKERYCCIGSSWGLLDLCFGRLKCFLVALCFVELSCVSNDDLFNESSQQKEVELCPRHLEASWNSIHFEWKWRNVPRAAKITLNLLSIFAWSLCPLMLDSLRCLWLSSWCNLLLSTKTRLILIPSAWDLFPINPRISQNRMMFTWHHERFQKVSWISGCLMMH